MILVCYASSGCSGSRLVDIFNESACCTNGGTSFSGSSGVCTPCPASMSIIHIIMPQICLKYSADPVCYDASTDCGTTGAGSTVSQTTLFGCCSNGGLSFNADDGSGCMICTSSRLIHCITITTNFIIFHRPSLLCYVYWLWYDWYRLYNCSNNNDGML